MSEGRTCIAADAAASSSAVPGKSGLIQERLNDGIKPAESNTWLGTESRESPIAAAT